MYKMRVFSVKSEIEPSDALPQKFGNFRLKVIRSENTRTYTFNFV